VQTQTKLFIPNKKKGELIFDLFFFNLFEFTESKNKINKKLPAKEKRQESGESIYC